MAPPIWAAHWMVCGGFTLHAWHARTYIRRLESPGFQVTLTPLPSLAGYAEVA